MQPEDHVDTVGVAFAFRVREFCVQASVYEVSNDRLRGFFAVQRVCQVENQLVGGPGGGDDLLGEMGGGGVGVVAGPHRSGVDDAVDLGQGDGFVWAVGVVDGGSFGIVGVAAAVRISRPDRVDLHRRRAVGVVEHHFQPWGGIVAAVAPPIRDRPPAIVRVVDGVQQISRIGGVVGLRGRRTLLGGRCRPTAIPGRGVRGRCIGCGSASAAVSLSELVVGGVAVAWPQRVDKLGAVEMGQGGLEVGFAECLGGGLSVAVGESLAGVASCDRLFGRAVHDSVVVLAEVGFDDLA
ncbi:hypothetical protein ACTD5D_20490 [Nocardia takedensis]|uniref:hypothetical protein n=1 Tax=Nocardia takedensis TaxID=259390 RepID=UPI003F7661AE